MQEKPKVQDCQQKMEGEVRGGEEGQPKLERLMAVQDLNPLVSFEIKVLPLRCKVT